MHVMYGPFVNDITNVKNYYDLDSQRTLQCRTDQFAFDSTASCLYMQQKVQFSYEDYAVGTMSSPFYNENFLLTGSAHKDNCMCNSGRESYCAPMGNQDWMKLHEYYRSTIVPKIKDIHRDFYFRYDLWLQAPYSKVTNTDIEYFSELVVNI